MKFYILDTGYLDGERDSVVHDTSRAPDKSLLPMPVLAFLIEHPNGLVLYDTGSNPKAMEGYWPKPCSANSLCTNHPISAWSSSLRLWAFGRKRFKQSCYPICTWITPEGFPFFPMRKFMFQRRITSTPCSPFTPVLIRSSTAGTSLAI